MSMRLPFLLLASVVGSLATGCSINEHAAGMQDDLGLAIDLDNSNILHSPYVAGSQFTISLQPGAHTTNDGWTLTSSNPSVLQVGAPGSGSNSNAFAVTAAGAGHATLTVNDKGGNAIDSADVDVDVPTRLQLCEQGLLYAGYSDDQAALDSVQVVDEGTATFLVRYFSDSQELHGNNALTATNSSLALASVTSTAFSASDFVQITGTSTGATSVHLAAGGATLDLPVTVVDPSAVQRMTLAPESESGAQEGQELYVFARAFDANGNDVYGSSFAWSVDGNTPQCCPNSSEPSDLLAYQYHASGTEDVSTSLDGQSASVTVHGTPSSTDISSSEDTGCSIGRGLGAPGSAAADVFLLGLVAAATRRRRALRRPREARR
jgi:hypothetical protein